MLIATILPTCGVQFSFLPFRGLLEMLMLLDIGENAALFAELIETS